VGKRLDRGKELAAFCALALGLNLNQLLRITQCQAKFRISLLEMVRMLLFKINGQRLTQLAEDLDIFYFFIKKHFLKGKLPELLFAFS
jgi:hypothetical protein